MDYLLGFTCLLVFLGIFAIVVDRLARSNRSSSAPSRAVLTSCPRCHTRLESPDAACPVCRWPNEIPAANRTPQALAALQRQLDHFHQLELIASDAHADLSATLSDALAAAVPSEETPLESVADDFVAAEIVAAEIVEVSAPPSPPIPASPPVAAARTPAPRPRRTMLEFFGAFLEEKNIRWGELVGGLLIVSCSIALVISFWAEIADRPFIKFGIFNGVTAALFGVGFYTDRRWKIRTTSRGLLIVAVLLVPLNFLAIAAFTNEAAPTDPLSLAGEGISLVFFSWLTLLAMRVLAPGQSWLAMAAVMVPSLMQLLTRRYMGPETPIGIAYALASVPLSTYVIATMTPLGVLRRDDNVSFDRAMSLFTQLGVVSFAMSLPLALLLYKSADASTMMRHLSPLLVVAATPAMATGLWSWRRLHGAGQSALQTASMAIGIFGGLTVATAWVLAWPDPATLLPSVLVAGLIFLAFGWRFEVAIAHPAAAAALAMAWTVAFHVVRGAVPWIVDDTNAMIAALFSAMTGNILLPLAATYLAAAAAWRIVDRPNDAKWWLLSAVGVAVVSTVLVTLFGFGRQGDPHGVTWTYAVYAFAATVMAVRFDRRALAWVASALVWATCAQGIAFLLPSYVTFTTPWVVALLTHATVAGVIGSSAAYAIPRKAEAAANGLLHSAFAGSLLAAATLVAETARLEWIEVAGFTLWLSVVWAALAWQLSWRPLFTVFQATLALAISCGVTAIVSRQAWYQGADLPWLDPWFWEAQGAALAVYAGGWIAVRVAANRLRFARETRAKLKSFLNPPWPAFDRVCEGAAPAILVITVGCAVTPGVGQELAVFAAATGRVVADVHTFELRGVPHEHALGWGTWGLWAAVGGAMFAGFWDRRANARGVGLLLVGFLACGLVATNWEADVAAASALRWLLAAYFVVAWVVIGLRTRIAQWMSAFGMSAARVGSEERHAGEIARGVLVALVIGANLAMLAYAGIAAVDRADIDGIVAGQVLGAAAWMVFAVLIGAAVASIDASAFGAKPPTVVADGRRLIQGFAHRHLAHVTCFLGIAPTIVATSHLLATSLLAYPVVGPNPGSWLHTIDWKVSYAVPAIAMGLVPLAHALVVRSSRFAYVSAMIGVGLGVVVATIRYARLEQALDAATWIAVTQLACHLAIGAAMIWAAFIAGNQRWRVFRLPALWFSLFLVGGTLFLLPVLAGSVSVVVRPSLVPWVAATGGVSAWVALGMVSALAGLVGRSGSRGAASVAPLSERAATFVMVIAVSLVSLTLAGWDTGNWLSYHALMMGIAIAAGGQLLWSLWTDRANSNRSMWLRGDGGWSERASALLCAVATALAFRGLDADPAGPWWTVGVLTAVSGLSVLWAWRSGRRAHAWAAAALGLSATSIWWIEEGHRLTSSVGLAAWFEFVQVNVVVLGVFGVISVLFERVRTNASRTADGTATQLADIGIALHRPAVAVGVLGLLVMVAFGLTADAVGETVQSHWALAAGAWLAMSASAIAGYWAPANRYCGRLGYFAGLAGAGIAWDRLDLAGERFWWAMALIFSTYVFAVGALWFERRAVARLLAGFGAFMDDLGDESSDRVRESQAWLVFGNGLLSLAATVVTYWIVVSFTDWTDRVSAGAALLLVAISAGWLASGRFRPALQLAALATGVLAAVAVAWGLLPPTIEYPVLHRTVVALVALLAMLPGYGFAFVKLWRGEADWVRAAQRISGPLAAMCCVLLLVVVGLEVSYFFTLEAVPIRKPALVAVAAALIGAAGSALAMAVVPGSDPLRLSVRGRTLYVYAAEVALGLLFVHLRVTLPWLFEGFFTQYWPLIVMAIAFLGVGFAEWCHRRRQEVLSVPLENTGALLPLLPVLGFWMVPTDVHFTFLLWSVGALYTVLSVLRKSFVFSVLAALSANGGLWYLLSEADGLGLAQHPQLWLIPPAVCVLVAAHFNRGRLGEQGMTTVRYLSTVVIYSASTGDVFLNGVAVAPWLPLVLAALAVAGIFAGILFRVRAFLYLGTAFLCVALFTMVWYAAEELEHTWVWWVSGIVAGAAILAVFGLFEKKRTEILKLAEQVQRWDA